MSEQIATQTNVSPVEQSEALSNNATPENVTPQNAAEQAAPVSQSTQEQATQSPETPKESQDFSPQGGVLDVYSQSSEAPLEYHFTDANGAEVKSETANIIAGMAKDLKLTQEQAQNFFSNSMGENGAITKLNTEALKVYNEQWAKEITGDPVLGGNNLANTKSNISRCMAFADDELKGLLQNAGLGNYPPLVRFLNKVGERLGSDTNFIGGGSPAKAQASDSPYSFLSEVYKDFK